MTGHLLMSTMHSGTPAGGLLRLLEMGIEPYQITSSIKVVLNQRLLRQLCESCKRKESESKYYQADGCETCMQTGYRGRTLIAEIVELDGALRRALLEKADLERLENLLQSRGHMNLRQDGMRLVNNGMTSLDELNKVCQRE